MFKRGTEITFGHDFIGTILTWALIFTIGNNYDRWLKNLIFVWLGTFVRGFLLSIFISEIFERKNWDSKKTFGYFTMILWELILIILMMVVFNFEKNLDRLMKNAISKISHRTCIALKKYFRYGRYNEMPKNRSFEESLFWRIFHWINLNSICKGY